MKIDSILNSKILNSRIFVFVVCAVFVVLSALYYYGLQCEFPPQPEDVMSITYMYSHLEFGAEYKVHEMLWGLCSFAATKIGGMTYFATRLLFTFLYAILLGGTVFLSLQSKTENRLKLYLIPLVALFCVILFPIALDPELFQWPSGVELIYEFPFQYHYASRIYAVVCLILLFLLLRSQERKRKIIYGILLAAICLYAMIKTDLIFYIMFLAPVVIVLFLHALRTDGMRKYAVFCMSGGMGVLLLSRVLPYSFLKGMWTTESADLYGEIYGAVNWASIDTLGINFCNYIKLISIIFNIQLPDTPVLSLYSCVYILKIAILVVGYIIVFHIIMCSFSGNSNRYHYDFIDEVLAWSYILLTGVYLFTLFGSAVICFRYFSGLTFAMTMLLCRNVEVFPEIIRIRWLKEIKYKKMILCVYIFILCICSAGKVWTYRVPDGYEPELKAIVEYIEGTDYGYAVAPFWLFAQIGALSNGEVMVYQTEEEIRDIYGDEAQVTYIITKNFDNSEIKGNYYDHCDTYEEMCEYYSEPTDIINYGKLQLVIYENGIEYKE